jgi:hypothetical protein
MDDFRKTLKEANYPNSHFTGTLLSFSFRRFPSASINFHQFHSVSINLYQFPSVSINFHEETYENRHQYLSVSFDFSNFLLKRVDSSISSCNCCFNHSFSHSSFSPSERFPEWFVVRKSMVSFLIFLFCAQILFLL